MRVAPRVDLSLEDRAVLEQQARGRSLPARLVERSRIVLRAADGLQDREIAAELGITPEKAARWRKRFLAGGTEALAKDAPRPGRGRTIKDRKVASIIKLTTSSKPANATHWSTRSMAEKAGVSEATDTAYLACSWSEAASVAEFQSQQRSRVCREARRCSRALSESSRARHRTQGGREEPDTGSGPHATRPADKEGPLRHDDP
jgi:transposase